MNKKTYTIPRIELIRLDSADILCTSPMTFSLVDDENINNESDVW